jgi:hypothetical protein
MCPYKDHASPTETFTDMPTSDRPVAPGGASKGAYAYVPPTLREGSDRTGDSMWHRNDENSVLVTNLSEDTCEPNLLELPCIWPC